MEYERKTYFKEHDYDNVKGFTILETKDGRYHVGEKWLKEEGDDRWIDYWISEDELLARVEEDACEPLGTLSDGQYEAVCEAVGWNPHADEHKGRDMIPKA